MSFKPINRTEVEVSIKLKGGVDDFTQLIDEVKELRELVPEHNEYEANKAIEKILNSLKSLIKVS